jgi:hypothetical protein
MLMAIFFRSVSILWRNWLKQKKQVTEETCELLASLDEKQKKLSEYRKNIVNI